MIILITGDKGFIGSHLRESLISEGHIVLGFDHVDDYDVGNITEDIVKKVNKIVHLAAYADVRASMEDPNKWYENNVVKSNRLFELCNKFNTQCIYASSSCVKEWWKSPYGTSKKVMEDMANVYGRFVGLRFSNVYGDNGRETMLLPLMLNGKLKYSTNHTRDFVHVNDVVDCIKLFLKMDNFDNLDELVYNVGTGKGRKISDLVKQYGFDVPITQGDPCEMEDNTADNANLLKLGWSPKEDLDKYLKRKLNGDTNNEEYIQGLLSKKPRVRSN